MVNESILQLLWDKKLFKNYNFVCTKGFPIEIIDFGQWNYNQGPDFLIAKIKYQDIIFVGNIELHVKTSDWTLHKHDQDSNYQKIILHVVFENDTSLENIESKNIPTLELKNYIDESVILRYQKLNIEKSHFIACEELVRKSYIPLFFHEENILKKLNDKSSEIQQQLTDLKNNYEAVLFSNLAYAFGLKVNAEIFKQIAESIDFNIINKIRQNPNALEALFFGIAGWLDNPADAQMLLWKREFDFLKSKYQLSSITISPKFSKLRPPNFPTIRLSQLAQLYYNEPHLFSKIKAAKSIRDLKSIFENTKTSNYWDNHYNFAKESGDKLEKKLSSDFIEIIIINAILPLKYWLDLQKEDINDDIIEFYKSLKPEKNNVIDHWKNLGIKSNNTLESQSLLYHYKNSCNHKKCLNCGIGLKILKQNE